MKGASVLITGGTGTFGHAFIPHALASGAARVIVFSRDEYKQHVMQQEMKDQRLRFFLGDVRDLPRLSTALRGVDTVVHAAALKQVPALEYNSSEAVKTNIGGASNVAEAALSRGVGKVVFLSSDKATNPINMYGTSKLAAEKLLIGSNAYGGESGTRFSVCRYGNIYGSRGSLGPVVRKSVADGEPARLTHPDMTRYYMTIDQAVALVSYALGNMRGGEVFVPRLESYSVREFIGCVLASVGRPDWPVETVGIRAGEKLHEALIGPDELANTRRSGLSDYYEILPVYHLWSDTATLGDPGGVDDSVLSSSPPTLGPDQLSEIIAREK
jgi:UDP-N-acetylglucosamine 4,6-dehydratase